jgi:hypothetical protein
VTHFLWRRQVPNKVQCNSVSAVKVG